MEWVSTEAWAAFCEEVPVLRRLGVARLNGNNLAVDIVLVAKLPPTLKVLNLRTWCSGRHQGG